jgi:hypothetical protein
MEEINMTQSTAVRRPIRLPGDAPALTLLNPWAYAITHKGKRVENRTWAAPERVDYLLIHAGKGWDKDSPRALYAEAWDLHCEGVAPTAAIVAVARLAHVCDSSVRNFDCGCDEWAAEGQYHWRLDDDVRVLDEPVPCSGRLGLWRPSADVLAAVQRQVGAC